MIDAEKLDNIKSIILLMISQNRPQNVREVKQKFEEKIQKFMQTLEEKGVQIIEKNVTIKKYKGTWKMKVDFTVMESAGIQRRTEIKSLQTDQGE